MRNLPPSRIQKSYANYGKKVLEEGEGDIVTNILRNLLRNHKSFSKYQIQGLIQEFRNLLNKFYSYGIRIPFMTDSQIAQAIESVISTTTQLERNKF